MKLIKFSLPSISFFLLVLLVVGQLSSFNHGLRIMKNDVDKSRKGEYPSSTCCFSRISPSQVMNDDDDDEFGSIYGMSERGVPQGPNPLHNWSYMHGWDYSTSLRLVSRVAYSCNVFSSVGPRIMYTRSWIKCDNMPFFIVKSCMKSDYYIFSFQVCETEKIEVIAWYKESTKQRKTKLEFHPCRSMSNN